jgi:hypothetical protein
VELVVKGLGDGMDAVPLITGAAESLESPGCRSPKRRRAAFKVASRVPADSRGGSDMVESVDSESVKESELVSEVGEAELEAVAVVDCRAGAEVSRSAGRTAGWAKGG